MKKLTLITAIILTANLLFAQINKIDTSFYSEALQETKMVDVYFPPGYDENPDLYYPVIYYLHAWLIDQNYMTSEMLSITQSMINSGTISPVIMVCADNSPDPFGGSMYANSILWGNYEDYMITDLINWIENSFRAVPSKNYRALLGHSMGGYGAFRYGTLHKDKFRVLAATASAMVNLTDQYLEYSRQIIMGQNPGPPFTYNYYTTEFSTKGLFLFCGAFSPNLNSPQTYINPQIVEFAMDENGYWIDTIVDKMKNNSIDHLIHQLSPEDSVGILFGCGSADVSIYPCHIAFKDTLDLLGLPYEFYDHAGGHIMPGLFKQRALIFIDSLMMDTITPSSTCLPGGITFTSQGQIDNFQSNHPFCSEIEGDVEIGHWPNSDITNLNGLSVLTSIGGEFKIYNNDLLSSLAGLDNVTSIGENLSIYLNSALTSLTGLDNVTSIGGGYTMICGNHDLTSLTGLDNLSNIGGTLSIGDDFTGGNPNLTSLTGLEGLTSVGEYLVIYDNGALLDLTGLDNLIYIGGDLAIYLNDTLTSLSGLNNLDSIGGSLKIGAIVSTWFGGPALFGNNYLLNIADLNNLSYVGENLWIMGNLSLQSLSGLNNLNIIEGDLHIVGNDSLTSLIGLDNITTIGGSLLTGVVVGFMGSFGNPGLQNLSGLENLTYVGGNLDLTYNYALSNIDSLSNLISIGGYLRISNNDSLTTLSGLENIESSSIENLSITNNEALSTCHVLSICNYLADSIGVVEIWNNAPGCNSPEEVEEACFTSVGESYHLNEFTIFPNPVNDQAVLSLNGASPGSIDIRIFNTTGICLKSWKPQNHQTSLVEFTLDLKDLQAGIYFCQVQIGNKMVTKKIIKL